MDTELDRGRAWTLAARGDLPRARSAMLAAADIANAKELHTLEAALLHDVARLGAPELVTDRLVACAKHVDGALMPPRVAFASALLAGDAEALEHAAAEFAAIGSSLFAAECEGAKTPALMHGTGTAVLTKREREVATLAAHGMSNKEVADTLFVSSRTVENHLQRAYEKLGVSSRQELGEALARAGY